MLPTPFAARLSCTLALLAACHPGKHTDDVDRGWDPDVERDTDPVAHTDTGAVVHTGGYVPSDTDTDVPTDTDPVVDTDAASDTDAFGDTDTDVPTDTDPVVDTDAASDTDAFGDTDTDVPTDTDSFGDTDTDVPTDTDAFGDTDTNAPVDTDAFGHTDTDTTFDTDLDGAVDSDADSDLDTDDLHDLALLESCALPTTWTPSTPWQHLLTTWGSVIVPADVACPDAGTPLPWTPGGTPWNYCATESVTCVVAFQERHAGVVDTGWGPGQGTVHTDEDRCYYTYVGPNADWVCGRPFRVADAIVTAPLADGDGWRAAVAVAIPSDPADRRAAADRWAADALAEHASIAAFARLTLDLLAHGAPATLLAAVQAATADEVRHAADAFGIASALAGRPLRPGPLPIDAAPTPSLVELAVATARDGGVGEALAAATAAARLSVARDPHTRAVLAGIVADEARHAALAWEVVAWAVEVGGDAVRDAVDAELRRLAAVDVPARPERVVPALGLCGDAAIRAAHRRVWQDVLAPGIAVAA